MSKAQVITLKENADTILTMREKIYRFIQMNPDTTIHEIETRLGIKETSVSGRISDLTDDGLIHNTGTVRKGSSTFTTYRTSDPLFIDYRKKKVKKEKFLKWYAKGKDYVDQMPDRLKLHFL